jgi:hypothetical protein
MKFYSFMTPSEVDFLLETAERELTDGDIYLEMGVYAMGTIGRIAEAHPNVTCWAIDLFDHRSLDVPGNISRQLIQEKHPDIEWSTTGINALIRNIIKTFPNIKTHLGRTRSKWIKDVKMQFIDADHRYDEVIADFWHAWSQAAPGALILGHDYYPGNGVFDAVGDISKILGEPGRGPDSIWFYRKSK